MMGKATHSAPRYAHPGPFLMVTNPDRVWSSVLLLSRLHCPYFERVHTWRWVGQQRQHQRRQQTLIAADSEEAIRSLSSSFINKMNSTDQVLALPAHCTDTTYIRTLLCSEVTEERYCDALSACSACRLQYSPSHWRRFNCRITVSRKRD